MTRLAEGELLELVDAADSVFLLEPPWGRKYVPLGLAKLARRLRENGSEVRFGRSFDGRPADLVLVSSLFTYDLPILSAEVQAARAMAPSSRVIVGGPAASLVPEAIEKTTGADVFVGVSGELDELLPDLEIDWQVEGKWADYTWAFTTRGCPNRCPYCAVWRIEKEPRIVPGWERQLAVPRPFVMLGDNNLASWGTEHLRNVVEVLDREGKAICIDSGIDCKYVTPEVAELLARVRFVDRGLRIGFDRIEEDGRFQGAVETLLAAGVKAEDMLVLALFNFRDTPREADYRMREVCRFGVKVYPQRYTPLRVLSRTDRFVGKFWTRTLVDLFWQFWVYRGPFANPEPFEDYLRREANGRRSVTDADWEAWNADRTPYGATAGSSS